MLIISEDDQVTVNSIAQSVGADGLVQIYQSGRLVVSQLRA